MGDSIFAESARLLDERGWLPRVPADPTERHGRLTLRQALREAAGLDEAAWLPAYIDWTTTTRPYSDAHRALEVILTEERDGQATDPEWWQAQDGRTIDELRQLLQRAETTAPNLAPPELPPRLRSGCTRKLLSSLQVAGVVSAAAGSAIRSSGVPLGKTILRALDGEALADISSESLVAALERVSSADEIERDVTTKVSPWRDLPEVCLAWHGACLRSVAFRPGRLLSFVAERKPLDLTRVPDRLLATALAEFRAPLEANDDEDQA